MDKQQCSLTKETDMKNNNKAHGQIRHLPMNYLGYSFAGSIFASYINNVLSQASLKTSSCHLTYSLIRVFKSTALAAQLNTISNNDASSYQTEWSLANLVFALLGLALGLYAIYRTIDIARKLPLDEEDSQIIRYHQRNIFWLAMAIVCGLAGVIVFLITEDLHSVMLITDQWTVINISSFVLTCLAMVMSIRNKETKS